MVKTIFWFRKSLRLHDNPALLSASAGASSLVCIFCLDPHFVGAGSGVGDLRLRYLSDALADLRVSLQRRQSRLLLLHGNPVERIPQFVRVCGAERLCFEADHEPYAVVRDASLTDRVQALGVAVEAVDGHLQRPLSSYGGLERTPKTYAAFVRLFEANGGAPPPAASLPAVLPPPFIVSRGNNALLEDDDDPQCESVLRRLAALDRGLVGVGGETSALQRLAAAVA